MQLLKPQTHRTPPEISLASSGMKGVNKQYPGIVELISLEGKSKLETADVV